MSDSDRDKLAADVDPRIDPMLSPDRKDSHIVEYSPFDDGAILDKGLFFRSKDKNPQQVDTGIKPVAPDPRIPSQVTNLVVTQAPSKQQDRTFSIITVSFTRLAEKFYQGVRIWFTGYKANSQRALISEGNDSPVSFLVESTGENVTVTVQAYGRSGIGADIDLAPTAVTKLDGVLTGPAAPVITQTLVSNPVGYQFAWGYLAGLAADVVDGYWVYRNTVNTFGTSVRYKFIKHPQNNLGSYTFIDAVSRGPSDPSTPQPYFYWVTAVNTKGLESASSNAAQSGTITSGSQIDDSGNLHIKNKVSLQGTTADPTTSSMTFSVMPEMTTTITTNGNKVLLTVTANVVKTVSGAGNGLSDYQFFVDGIAIGGIFVLFLILGNQATLTMTFIDVPAAGTHTYDLRWRINAGGGGETISAVSTNRVFQAVEIG